MATARIIAERRIAAPAPALYALLADYQHGHPSILPPAFRDFTVLEGGIGAGTRIRFNLRSAGRTRPMEAVVSEPEPGRVLSETYQDNSVTTFLIESAGADSRLRIETSWQSHSSIAGLIERFLARRLLGSLYDAELDLIEQWAAKRSTSVP
jgi:hypothetical protein